MGSDGSAHQLVGAGIMPLASKMKKKAIQNQEWSEDDPPHVNIFYCMGGTVDRFGGSVG
jgi:hypothetical protein